ncbi:hypothetical protein C0995_004504, partial [Termitomyces sp. Mi166
LVDAVKDPGLLGKLPATAITLCKKVALVKVAKAYLGQKELSSEYYKLEKRMPKGTCKMTVE